MSEPFIAEIDIFPYTFAPRDWALCEGQIVEISQNTALFSLIGTIYGGDGRTTMNLPNLEGRAPLGHGQGPGLSFYVLGERPGAEAVVLTEEDLPAHSHVFAGENGFGTDTQNSNSTVATGRIDGTLTQLYSTETDEMKPMATRSLGPSGQSQAHENRQPFLAMHFCIAMVGLYPPRN